MEDARARSPRRAKPLPGGVPPAGAAPSGRTLRVALLTNVVSPYRVPVYRDLSETRGWQLRVFVEAESEPGWERAYAGTHERGCRAFDVERVRSASFGRRVNVHGAGDASQRVETRVPIGAFAALQRFRPDAIISGELGARSAFAALYARLYRVPLTIWTYQSRSWAATAGALRRVWRGALLDRADAVVGMGRQAREVLASLGVPPERLFDAPNAHDRDGLAAGLASCDATAVRAAQRAALGCRDRVALLAGRLVAAKGVRPLLAAWRSLDAPLRRDWTLLAVGDGPLRPELEAAARDAEPGEIVCAGAIAASNMAEFYAGADLLLFPSLGDPWGLVVNEALACGVPALCSKLAGCADDLMRHGENGWTFDPLDAGDFASALARALSCADLARMGERGRETVKRFTPEEMADGLRKAVAHATRG